MTMRAKSGSLRQGEARVQREADRLLARLAEEATRLVLDQSITPPMLVTARLRGRVSVSSGRFSCDSMKWLVSQGCVQWQATAPTYFEMTAEGRSRLQRLSAQFGEYGVDAFTEQHLDLKRGQDGADRSVRLWDETESPLTWLARRKGKDGQALISTSQFQAGERLRQDLTLAAMLPRVTANWQSVGSGAGGVAGETHSDLVVAARQRAENALSAVGPEMNGLLIDLCGFLKGLEQIERERGWPPRSGKVVLGLALNCLAGHYGLQGEARGPDHARIRHWGTPDYRPTIGAPNQ